MISRSEIKKFRKIIVYYAGLGVIGRKHYYEKHCKEIDLISINIIEANYIGCKIPRSLKHFLK